MINEQEKLLDAILGTRKTQRNKPNDWRSRSFGGLEDILEQNQRLLEERIEKLEKSKAKAPKSAQLTNRERKMLEVIRRGSRGRLYCRELDNAGITPRRRGVWGEAPRTYVKTYDQGALWRHRIDDEKYKIRRKAEFAKHAGE